MRTGITAAARRALPLLIVAVFGATGCKQTPSTATVRRQLENEIPGARFERDSHVRLGRFALALVKPIVRWALDADDEARRIVTAIDRVEVSTYRVLAMPESIPTRVLTRLEGRMRERGWSQMVRESDGRDGTWVFSLTSEDGDIRGLLVVELDASELTIVGVEGRLDEVLAQAIADDPEELSGLLDS